MRRPAFLVIVLVQLIFVAFAVAGASYELRPLMALAETERGRLDLIRSGSVAPARSHYANKLIIELCLASATSLHAKLQPVAERQTVLRQCDLLISTILAGSLTSSYAWAVGALVARELADNGEFDKRLARSQETGANELWIAEQRFVLFALDGAKLSRATRERANRDLLLLLGTARGRAILVAQYVASPQLREIIAAALDGLPQETVNRFLDQLYKRLDQADGNDQRGGLPDPGAGS